ncbi:fibronectin type III domain-containing protein [Candidatus Electronema sp. TJ]|uniref:fibronectin type III domain-containing protein n=1 Tax=Candidatus Electronema sp. TJ TaxID=3401573 RepID=UPI003AA862A1
MPRFPISDPELIALAQKLIAGLQDNPDFPTPPVSPAQLQASLDAFVGQCDAQTAAQAAAEQATAAKNTGHEQLAAEMKGDLRYAEYAVEGDDAKLSTLGWGAKSPHTPISAPGQPFKFQIMRSGPGAAKATWKRPVEGGHAACYLVKMRGEGGTWVSAGTFVEPEAELTNLERGKELEFYVLALNRAGESLPSNSMTVVL